MCAEHQNHRTGNCAECRKAESHLPPMPLLWSDEGDDN